MEDVDNRLLHSSLRPVESTSQRASGSVQPFLFTVVTDRSTDHATLFVAIGRI